MPTELQFKPQDAAKPTGCGVILFSLLFLFGICSGVFLLFNLTENSFNLFSDLSILTVVLTFVLVLASFLARNAKLNRGILTLSPQRIQNDDFSVLNTSIKLRVYYVKTKRKSRFYAYTINDNRGKFFMLCVYQDALLNALLERNWVPTEEYHNVEVKRLTFDSGSPKFEVSCKETGHVLFYNTGSGLFSFTQQNRLNKDGFIKPKYYIQNPNYKRY